MATKTAKKAQIRAQILSAAHVYAKELAGKVFLYVYGNEYLEIIFKRDCFLHLTGVDTLYLPRTLRVKDHSIERSSDGEVVDFIFMREATTNIYKTLTFADPNKKIPMIIKDMIDPSFFR